MHAVDRRQAANPRGQLVLPSGQILGSLRVAVEHSVDISRPSASRDTKDYTACRIRQEPDSNDLTSRYRGRLGCTHCPLLRRPLWACEFLVENWAGKASKSRPSASGAWVCRNSTVPPMKPAISPCST